MQAELIAGGVQVTIGGERFWMPADEARALKRWLIEHDFNLWEIIDSQLKRADEKEQETHE